MHKIKHPDGYRPSLASFARIIAAENINVQVDTSKANPEFDMRARTLSLPKWNDVSPQFEDMMVIHETGHALFSPHGDTWGQTAKAICPQNPEAGAAYLNVVEDVRIEKKMLAKYPGAKRDFSVAYREAHESGMFGVNDTDMGSLSFVDRVNMHFKLGRYGLVNVPFTADERRIVDEIDSCETWEDVTKATKNLLNYQPPQDAPEQGQGQGESNQQGQGQGDGQSQSSGGSSSDGNQQQSSGGGAGGDPEGEKSQDESDSDSGDGDESESEDQSDGNSENESESDSDSESGDGDESESDSDSDSSDDGDSDGEEDESESSATGQEGGAGDPAMPQTQQNFDQSAEYLAEKSSCNNHDTVKVTHEDASAMILDWKDFTDIVDPVRRRTKRTGNESGVDYYAELLQAKKKDVGMVTQMFNRKKAADEWRRTQSSRTGQIDTNKLIHYKTREDIFRRTESVKEGKNHGLYMVIDWSGSMSNILRESVDQALMLALFCKQANIPFEVLFFTNAVTFAGKSPYNSGPGFPIESVSRGYHAIHNHMTLVNVLSDRMSNQQFKDGIRNLRFLAEQVTLNYGQRRARGLDAFAMSGTPLEESIVAARNGVLEFRKRTQAQVVHTLFLTDGEGCSTLSNCDSLNLIDTKHNYNQYCGNNAHIKDTQALLCDWFRATTGSTISNFYLTSGDAMWAAHRMSEIKGKALKKACEEFKTFGGTSLGPSSGFDDLYLVDFRFKTGQANTFGMNASESLTANANHTKGKRIVLDRFTTMIAT